MDEKDKLKVASSLFFDFKPNYLKQTNNSLIGSELDLSSYLYLNTSGKEFDIIELYLKNFCLYYSNYDLVSGFKLYSAYLFGPVLDIKEKINKFLKQNNNNFKENRIYLPKRKNKLERLSVLINLRGSTRHFFKQKLTLKDLSTILSYSYGITSLNKRSFSSAGGLYPIDLYFYANNVENLNQQVYSYDYFTNSIFPIKNDKTFDFEKAARMDGIDYLNSSIFIFFTWNSNLSRFKYNIASLGFAFIELGEITRNIELVALSLDYGTCALGGINKNYLDEYLDLDNFYLTNTMHAIILGRKR